MEDDHPGSAGQPGGPEIGPIVRHPSIITDKVRQAARLLDEAIKEAVSTSNVQRDAAEGQLSSLFGTAWNRAELHIKRIPVKRSRTE